MGMAGLDAHEAQPAGPPAAPGSGCAEPDVAQSAQHRTKSVFQGPDHASLGCFGAPVRPMSRPARAGLAPAGLTAVLLALSAGRDRTPVRIGGGGNGAGRSGTARRAT